MSVEFEPDEVLARRLRAVEAQLRIPDLLTTGEQLADELATIAAILEPAEQPERCG